MLSAGSPPPEGGSHQVHRQAWATALALAWLEEHGGAFEDEWRMVADKGRRWLHDALPEPSDESRWIHQAKGYLRP